MGRNSAIKRFDARIGQPLELLDDRNGRRGALEALLASPWLVRASELVHRDGSSAARHVVETVTVEWDSPKGRPAAFTRGSRRYCVDAVLQVWASEKSWWDPRRKVSKRYWRVLSRDGVYDLAFDRVSGAWQLIGIQD